MGDRFLSTIGSVILLLAIFFVGWWCGRAEARGDGCEGGVESRVETTLIVDTLLYHSIKPFRVEALGVGSMDGSTGFGSKDGSIGVGSKDGSMDGSKDESSEDGSSETIPTSPSLYTFRDTISGRWSAEVVGRDVELRSLTIVDRNEIRNKTIKRYTPPKWEVSLKAELRPQSQWIGIEASKQIGRASISLNVGYDRWTQQPYLATAISFAIWRKY